LKPDILVQLWNQRRPLLGFALAFQLLENLLFAPAMGFLGQALQGRPVVDSTELVAFFLSPRGFLLLFLAATAWLTIRLVEQAGLSALVLGLAEGRPTGPSATFRWLARELPRLAAVGARVVGWALAVTAPLGVAAGLIARPLLARHDINYYLADRPPEFVMAVAALGVMAAATIAAGVWLLVRWRLVVQVCVFERRHARAAFREAAALSQGVRWALLGRCLAVIALLLALMVAAAALEQVAVWLALLPGHIGRASLAVSFGTVLLLRTVVGAAVTSAGACAEATVFTSFYRQRRNALGGPWVLPAIEEQRGASSSLPVSARLLGLGVVGGLIIATGVATALAADALRHERPMVVTAHRGGHHRAPENTAASIREAIAAGAQFAEIDVQLSKDGVLVVTHDSDFSRMAGVARKVRDLTYSEIRAIPLGRSAAPEFRNEPAPTLAEVLRIARGQIGLNIELKSYGDHQPRLARLVVEAVRAHQMTNQVIIQCLEYEPLREVRRLAPEIPVGYLMAVNAVPPGKLEVDFLSVELRWVTGAFVRAAHRHGQAVHVWTVDSPEAMEQMIAVGADALITNEPAEALRLVREYENLSAPQRRLRRVNAWLAR
jgi:glycerophosphoryl diester phosphodiesterase